MITVLKLGHSSYQPEVTEEYDMEIMNATIQLCTSKGNKKESSILIKIPELDREIYISLSSLVANLIPYDYTNKKKL